MQYAVYRLYSAENNTIAIHQVARCSNTEGIVQFREMIYWAREALDELRSDAE